MELSLLRFLMQGLHSSYRIDEEAPMKTLVSIYLNSKEYPIPVSCRAEVKATLLSGLIICSSSFEKLFDTEKDKIIERALLDLGPRSPLYLNLAALGALIVLSLSDLLSVTKSKSPSGKSFRAVLEGELMKIEEVCNKEGLWM